MPTSNQQGIEPLPTELPPDLAVVVTAWPTLPENVKLAILALAGVKT